MAPCLQWRFQTDVQDSWSSVAGIIQAIGAGQPECKPGPLPVNCTGRLRGAESVWCASFCVERDQVIECEVAPLDGDVESKRCSSSGDEAAAATAAASAASGS